MSKVKVFDVNEVEWKRDWDGGLASCEYNPSDSCTLQYWELPAGSGAAPHSHPEEQLTYVPNGKLLLTVDGEEFLLTEGCYAYIPPNAVHSTKNVGSAVCVNIDVFMPDRSDREGSVQVREFSHDPDHVILK